MINFFHRLFNPHCEHCRDDDAENEQCVTCNVLLTQLEQANAQIRTLTEAWIHKDDKPFVTDSLRSIPKPIVPRHTPWKIKREELEAEDRKKADVMRQKNKELADNKSPTGEMNNEEKSVSSVPLSVQTSVEELEKELGVVNES